MRCGERRRANAVASGALLASQHLLPAGNAAGLAFFLRSVYTACNPATFVPAGNWSFGVRRLREFELMSWRTGLEMYLDVLDVVDKHDMGEDERLAFKAHLLKVFLDWDIDPCGLEDDPIIGPIFVRLEQIEGESEGPNAT